MAEDNDSLHQSSLVPTCRWPTCWRVRLRRRKLTTVRLGGKMTRRRQFFVAMFRKMRLKCLQVYYSRMVKKLQDYFRNLVTDMIQAAGTIEAYHQRLLMESSFLVPVMGLPISSYSLMVGSEHPRYPVL